MLLRVMGWGFSHYTTYASYYLNPDDMCYILGMEENLISHPGKTNMIRYRIEEIWHLWPRNWMTLSFLHFLTQQIVNADTIISRIIFMHYWIRFGLVPSPLYLDIRFLFFSP